MKAARRFLCLFALTALVLLGCGKEEGPKQARSAPGVAENAEDAEQQVKDNLAKLSPEDRKLAEAQRMCPLMPGVRLGAKGTPRKVMAGDEAVFVCCGKCEQAAKRDPAQALARLKDMKAKEAQGTTK